MTSGRSRAIAVLVAVSMVVACGKKAEAPAKAGADKTAKDKTAEAKAAGAEGDKPGKVGDKAAKTGAADKKAAAPAAKAEKQEVLLWHAYRDAERAALDKLIGAWNSKQPNVQVKALAVPFDALIDKLQVAIPRGNGPDLIIFAHDKIGTWARDKLIQPLGKWATGDRLKRFLPQTIKPLVFERAIYGLPLAFKSLVLFYNSGLIKEPPATMKDLVEVAKKHTDKEEGKFGFAYDAADLYFHAAFLHAYGGAVYDDKAGKLTIASEGAANAAKAVRALHADDKVLPKGMSTFVVTAMFSDNKVPFVLNGPWFISEIEKGVKWAVAPMPKADNGQPLKPFLGSEAVMLSAQTKVKDAALKVLDYLTSDEAALTRLSEGKQMVANTKVYENPRWASDPVIKVFRAQADVSVPMSNAVEAGLAWQPYNNALRKIIFGGAPADETLKAAQATADAALSKLKR